LESFLGLSSEGSFQIFRSWRNDKGILRPSGGFFSIIGGLTNANL
jgi:hypothetical protein